MGLFGKEQILLILDKYDYKAGDKITGKAQLNLKKPVRARKLEIGLIGKRIDKQSSMALGPMMMKGGKDHSSQSQHSTVYDFKIPLDGEKEYQTGEYSFEIKIPENIHQNNPTLEGNVGKAAGALKMLSGLSSRIDWYVKAELDVPMKLDINKKQKIVIS
ncbi:MAG: hypothetical protein KKC68_03110 [Candidatus Thermoplasmatota archaeon]|nr:hypothetical protein [Candidatus Thermoplasmatota archaeon]MBU1940742.1 hypothetical protein [Candidatus Thermoplasmatota archaeon]